MISLRTMTAGWLLVSGSLVTAWAQDSWGPSGSVLSQQIAEALQQARPGNRTLTVGLLQGLAKEAEKSQQWEAWAWAQTGVSEQVLEAEDEGREWMTVEPQKILEEVIRRCRQQGVVGPLGRALAAHARCLAKLDRYLPAAQEWEQAGSFALDANRVDQAVVYFLCAARVYRNQGHVAKLRESQSWLDVVERERGTELNKDSKERLAKFRESSKELLVGLPGPALNSVTPASLQPEETSVLVSSSEQERGRARFTLSNHQSRAVEGVLTLSATQGAVWSWHSDGAQMHLILRPDVKPRASQQRVRLLPGQKLKVFLDYRFQKEAANFSDTLSLSWSDGNGHQDALANVEFRTGAAPRSQVINANRAGQRAGWPVPFYHEIYYRGANRQIENILATTSSAARVEIYNEDTGELLAIDAEGNGDFRGPQDFLDAKQDRDGDGRPDLVVSPQNPVGSLEVYVFPAASTSASTRLSLSLADYSTSAPQWRRDIVNEQLTE
jgi:hypothetical protein